MQMQTETRPQTQTEVNFCDNCDHHSKLGHHFCPDCGRRTNGDNRDTTTYCPRCVVGKYKAVLSERVLQEECFCPNCRAVTKALFEPTKMLGF